MDDPLVNTQAEVYALIRQKALLDAECEAIEYGKRCMSTGYMAGQNVASDIAGYIRKLMRKEEG